MRVLALVPSFFGSTGDAVNERQLLVALAERVERCYVVTFIGFRQLFTERQRELKVNLPANMTVIPLFLPGVKFLISLFFMIGISCLISIIGLVLNALKKIDLIYIRISSFSMGVLTFKSLARKTIVKIPSTIEDDITNNLEKSLIRLFLSHSDRIALAKAKAIATPNPLLYNNLALRRRFTAKRVIWVPAGVHLQLIKKVKSKVKGRRNSNNNFQICFLGTLVWWQGTDTLVRAIHILNRVHGIEAKLTIIGDGPERPLVETLCKMLGVWCEITGYLPHEKALEKLASCDVLVLPRKRTPITEAMVPLKVLEAWALGVPVVTTRHKIYEVLGLRSGEDLMLCEPEPSSIAEAVSRVLLSKNLLERLRENGYRLVREFQYSKLTERILSIAYDN